MARLPRLTFAGLPHLLVLEAEASQSLFVDDQDRKAFVAALLDSSRACTVAIHAYSLLDDQVLMLVTPPKAEALQQFMQRLGRRYVGAFNQRHGRAGALWARRYGSAVIDSATQGWAGLRLVEQQAVRARRVQKAEEWPWSSAPHHAGRGRDLVVHEHALHWSLGNTPFEREARHAQMLSELLTEDGAHELIRAAMRGWPIGPPAFVASLDDVRTESQRALTRRPRGRPKGKPLTPS